MFCFENSKIVKMPVILPEFFKSLTPKSGHLTLKGQKKWPFCRKTSLQAQKIGKNRQILQI